MTTEQYAAWLRFVAAFEEYDDLVAPPGTAANQGVDVLLEALEARYRKWESLKTAWREWVRLDSGGILK